MDRKQIAIDFAEPLNHPEIVKIILFGSVARGDDNEESDIDILIIISEKSDEAKIEEDIYSKTFDILMKTGEYVSAKIKPLNHYNKYKSSFFFSNIDKEGIIL
ncbi:MAG: nucleotidyltransferase domain-containing protein [Methanobrevibacter sp.]|jgi:predicted nucleotidyltransferase|nr:nucleotidyltransferase domain-containing protein [Candidatus Methanovirga procula]